MRRNWALAVICLALGLYAPSQARLLMGEVEHADKLAPVEQKLAPGSTFDRSNLPVQSGQDSNNWYRIPPWLAGEWHKDSQTDYYRFDYATNKSDTTTRVIEARSNGVWGVQTDDQGNIWQFDPAPFTTSVDAGDDTIVQLVRMSEPLESTKERFIRRSINTQIRVDKATNVIKGVESGEQISVYAPETDGLIKRETSSKVFDVQGQPVLLGKSFSFETRTAPYAPRSTFQGKDMRKLFQDFLSRNPR